MPEGTSMDANQADIAWQIREQAADLSRRATEANLPMLAYLLDCARIEANNIIEQAGGANKS
jgi:hypothetical protein